MPDLDPRKVDTRRLIALVISGDAIDPYRIIGELIRRKNFKAIAIILDKCVDLDESTDYIRYMLTEKPNPLP